LINTSETQRTTIVTVPSAILYKNSSYTTFLGVTMDDTILSNHIDLLINN